jgi:hypothetical protein
MAMEWKVTRASVCARRAWVLAGAIATLTSCGAPRRAIAQPAPPPPTPGAAVGAAPPAENPAPNAPREEPLPTPPPARPPAPPPSPPAPAGTEPASNADLAARVAKLEADAKKQLPFTLGAGAYLFYYQSTEHTTLAGPGDRRGSFQPYFFWVTLDKETTHGTDGKSAFGAHAELRFRDGGHVGAGGNNAYVRSFFSSNMWFSEVYAYYRWADALNIRVGKVKRNFGLGWDDSFFGPIPHFDGWKPLPEYGLSISGSVPMTDRLALTYSGQYMLHSAGTNDGLSVGRTVGAHPGTDRSTLHTYDPNPEGELDSAGNRMTIFQHVAVGRVGAVLTTDGPFSANGAISALTGLVERSSAIDKIDDSSHFSQLAADLTLAYGPMSIYAEYADQLGPGVRDADYLTGGIHATFSKLQLRLNTSYVRYRLSPDVQEFNLLPGLTYKVTDSLAIMLEFDEWRRKDPRLSGDFTTYDRSVNLIFKVSF